MPRPAAPAPRPTTGGVGTHGPTTGGASSHGPTTGGVATHGPTTGGATTHGPTTGSVATHGPTTGGATSHGPTTGGVATHGPTTGGATTHGPTTGGINTGGFSPGTHPNGPGGRNANTPHPTSPSGTHTTPARTPGIKTPQSRGSNVLTTKGGSLVRTRPNGKISDVHNVRSGTDVHQGLNHGRSCTTVRNDHSKTVYQKGRAGYVQHPYKVRGHDFERRTYSYRGHSYDHFYHGWRYHGVDMDVYAPSGYYDPGYYGWAYNPWAAPVHYGWGWGGSPWFHHFGFFFSPYPAYPSAAYWLTDYMLANDLQSAYAAQQDGGEVNGDPNAAGGAAPLTPDVKQAIADEVRNQLALENQEAQQNAQRQDIDPGSSGIGRTINDVANGRPHVFVVGNALDVVDGSGMECSLSDGDALILRNAPAADATAADVDVLASKGGQECPKADTVSVNLDDLQEMQNHMRESIDQGLQQLQTDQGKGGLPVAPVSAQVHPALYASLAPPPDPNAASEIQQEGQQADLAQNEVISEVSQQTGAPVTTPTIMAGQTISQVEAILGQPSSKAILGPKTVYNYNGMKVIFVGGRVTNVD